MLYNSSLELIGHTPLVRLSKIKIPNNNRIFAKLEGANPAGGVKDRVALHILSKLQKEGKLTKDSVIIEATAGNTGLGIAFVALHFGVRAILIVPDKFSIEKQILMRSLGAEVINTKKSDGMQGAITLAKQMIESNQNAISINQFDNLENPMAHYLTTAQEIWDDLANLDSINTFRANKFSQEIFQNEVIDNKDFSKSQNKTPIESSQNNFKSSDFGDLPAIQNNAMQNNKVDLLVDSKNLDSNTKLTPTQNNKTLESNLHDTESKHILHYFVAGAGSGGSFSGISRYLKEQDKTIQSVLCDPLGSIIGGGCEACANIEGIGNNFIPATMDTSLIDKVIKITDDEAYCGVRMLANTEGILAGISSGACLQACLKLAKEVQDCIIVTLFADDLSRYFSRNLI